MATYAVVVSWLGSQHLSVEADTEEEAYDRALEKCDFSNADFSKGAEVAQLWLEGEE